jgi:hypothetical protein
MLIPQSLEEPSEMKFSKHTAALNESMPRFLLKLENFIEDKSRSFIKKKVFIL